MSLTEQQAKSRYRKFSTGTLLLLAIALISLAAAPLAPANAATLVASDWATGASPSTPYLRSGHPKVKQSSPTLKPLITRVAASVRKARLKPGGKTRLRIQVTNGGGAPARNIRVALKSSNHRVNLRVSSFRIKYLGPRSSAARLVTVRVSRWARGRARLTARAARRSGSASVSVLYLGPCLTPLSARRLLCPDLKVGKPSEMYVDYGTKAGRTLLRSTNDIQSRGKGPMELRGIRDRPRTMAVMQAIRRRAGGYARFPVQARLRFYNVGAEYGGSYWKVRNPLRFELWKLDGKGKKTKRVRVGPKQFYCFRDLMQTNPGPRSPSSAVYPACNQNPRQDRVTLGTSVGWSDIYPSTYDHQWIDVSGLRGCFAYVLRVDPKGLLYESREGNNVSQRKVRLPYRGSTANGC